MQRPASSMLAAMGSKRRLCRAGAWHCGGSDPNFGELSDIHLHAGRVGIRKSPPLSWLLSADDGGCGCLSAWAEAWGIQTRMDDYVWQHGNAHWRLAVDITELRLGGLRSKQRTTPTWSEVGTRSHRTRSETELDEYAVATSRGTVGEQRSKQTNRPPQAGPWVRGGKLESPERCV